MTAKFDEAARVALAAIVADPDLGPGVLSDPAVLSRLLTDYLPGSPRETGPLLAAAQADVARALSDHVARGMDAATAIRITAANLASRTAYSADACLWVAGELAVALGHTTADRLPALAPPAQRTDVAGQHAHAGSKDGNARPDATASSGPATAEPIAQGPAPAPGPRRRRHAGWLVAAIAAVTLAVAAGGVALYYGRNLSGGTPATTGGAVHQVPKVTIGTFVGVKPAVIDFSADGERGHRHQVVDVGQRAGNRQRNLGP